MTAILKVDTIQDTSGNNIINESSDTITIGASGDTVNVIGTLQSNGSAVPTVAGGITEADNWRLTANTNAGTNGYVTTNWERNDTAGFSKIGTGLSESSGVFSFASTGIYLINYFGLVLLEGSDVNVEYKLYTTLNNSSYTLQTIAVAGSQSNPDGVRGSMSNSFIFDVTDTSNCKFKFYTDSFNSATALIGDSSWTGTGFTTIRLGDT